MIFVTLFWQCGAHHSRPNGGIDGVKNNLQLSMRIAKIKAGSIVSRCVGGMVFEQRLPFARALARVR